MSQSLGYRLDTRFDASRDEDGDFCSLLYCPEDWPEAHSTSCKNTVVFPAVKRAAVTANMWATVFTYPVYGL